MTEVVKYVARCGVALDMRPIGTGTRCAHHRVAIRSVLGGVWEFASVAIQQIFVPLDLFSERAEDVL